MTTAASYSAVVQELYVTYFGRPADFFGLQNFEAALAAANAPTTGISALLAAYSTNAAVKSLVDSFGTSTESATLYGSVTTPDGAAAFVNAVFENLFGRAPQIAGLTFWVSQLENGTVTAGNAALAIAAGAQSNTTPQGVTDAATIAAKVAVAGAFTSDLTTSAEVIGYSGSEAAGEARALLNGVTSTTTVAGEAANITATITSIINHGPGTVYTLTTGVDTITGGPGNNIVNGSDTTLTGLDVINGGSTTSHNTLNLSDVAGDSLNVGIATITDFSNLNVTSTKGLGNSGVQDYSAITGLTTADVTLQAADTVTTVTVAATTALNLTVAQAASNLVTVNGGSVDTVIVNSAAAAGVLVNGGAGTTAVSVTNTGVAGAVEIFDVKYPAGVTNTTATSVLSTVSLTKVASALIFSDALTTLNLTNTTGTVDIEGVATGPLTINASGATNVVTDTSAAAITVNALTKSSIALAVGTTDTALTVGGAGALTLALSGATDVATLTIVGAGGVTADLSGLASGAAIDASASSGTNVVTLSATETYKGGSGTDIVTLTAIPSVSVDGGTGTNTLVLSGIADLTTLTSKALANATDFQVLELTGVVGATAATLDLSALPTSIGSSLVIDAATGSADLSLINGASTTTLTLGTTLEENISLTLATPGKSDVLNLNLGSATDKTTVDFSTGGTLTATAETVHVVTAGAAAHTDSLALHDTGATTLTVAGAAGVDFSLSTFGALTSIDTSAVAAKNIVTFGAADTAAAGVTITGGASALTVTGAASATHTDTVTGVAGVLDYTGTTAGGKSVITAGDGAGDTVTLSAVGTTADSVTLGNGKADHVTVGNGNTTITVGNGGDTIVAGNGNNHITAGTGVDSITVGGGLNTVTTGGGADTVIISAAGANGNIYTTITDFTTKGETLTLPDATALTLGTNLTGTLGTTAVFQDYLNAAVKTAAAHQIDWFQWNGDTYVVDAVDGGTATSFTNGTDVVVKLTGTVDLTHATLGTGTIVHA
jgi:S-layer protein